MQPWNHYLTNEDPTYICNKKKLHIYTYITNILLDIKSIGHLIDLTFNGSLEFFFEGWVGGGGGGCKINTKEISLATWKYSVS